MNAKYMELLSITKDPLEQDVKIDKSSDCSYESDTDGTQSDEEFIKDIKVESNSGFIDLSNDGKLLILYKKSFFF